MLTARRPYLTIPPSSLPDYIPVYDVQYKLYTKCGHSHNTFYLGILTVTSLNYSTKYWIGLSNMEDAEKPILQHFTIMKKSMM